MSTDHIVSDMNTQEWRCEHCGAREYMNLPREAAAVAHDGRKFVDAHKGCNAKRFLLADLPKLLKDLAQPMHVLHTERLSRRDHIALELFRDRMKMSIAARCDQEFEARAAYSKADALIKASGEGSDGN